MTILDAVREQDFEGLKQILEQDPTAVDERDDQGCPVPFLAAASGNFEMVKYLVEYSRASMNLVDGQNRNILHYAAMSGNVPLCQYLVEKVGMDIASGDRNLVTPYQIAYETGHEGLLRYFEEKMGAPYEEMYHNPIRHGMFPDPSIVRVGDDFYMVNSSFVYFPCIPISHSKDLVHWEIIGHAITNPEWSKLGDLEGGRGYWAPDISYDNGTFYICATYRMNDTGSVLRRQVVVSSNRPEGPYGEPSYIEEDGIDPSIFHDDDGKHYMLLNRGARIFELSSDCKRQVSEARLLYYGDQKRAPEGPHLLKKDGWYYLFLAEGGTGAGHRVSVARSRELFGNYEPCPYNPIMRQEDEGAGIWRCGHGKPVQTAAGDWYMVYLCGRKLWREAADGPAICSMLGRETALDPVRWTKDGWPIVNERNGPSVLQKRPDLPIFTPKESLDKQWVTPREPEADGIRIVGNRFVLKGSKAPLSDVAARNLCLRRQTSFAFDAEVKLLLESILPSFAERDEEGTVLPPFAKVEEVGPVLPSFAKGQEAGLVCYYDENSWVCCAFGRDEKGFFLQVKEQIGRETVCHEKGYLDGGGIGQAGQSDCLGKATGSLTLGVRTDGLERQFHAQMGDFCWESELFEDIYYLCDEGVPIGKRFTGAMVGMYAFRGEGELFAEFEDFTYRER